MKKPKFKIGQELDTDEVGPCRVIDICYSKTTETIIYILNDGDASFAFQDSEITIR